jgi:hypothetical protein
MSSTSRIRVPDQVVERPMGSLRPLAVGGVIMVMLLSIGVLTTMRFAADSTSTPQAVPTQLSPASSDPSTGPAAQASSAAGSPSAHLAVPGGPQPARTTGPARPPGESSRVPNASTRAPADGDDGGTGDSSSERTRGYHRDFNGPDEPNTDRDQHESHDPAEDRMTRQAADAICDHYNLPRESCERAASR